MELTVFDALTRVGVCRRDADAICARLTADDETRLLDIALQPNSGQAVLELASELRGSKTATKATPTPLAPKTDVETEEDRVDTPKPKKGT